VKSAILLHGTGGSDTDYFWFADTKQRLKTNGYEVWWPLLPNTDRPELQESLAFVLENLPSLDEQSIIVGHSSACPLILSLLERIDSAVAKAVLVSGFYQKIDDEYSPLMLQDGYDWQKIRANVKEIYFLNSDNDPWGCKDQQARTAAEELGVPLIIMFGQGHMGSASFNQPFNEFPFVNQLLGVGGKNDD